MNDLQRLTVGAFEVVSVMQRFASIGDHARGVERRERPAALHPAPGDRREVLSRDELHRDVVGVAFAAEVVDLDDVRMVELRAHPRFVEEHLDEGFLLREVAQDLLDDDEAIESGETSLARQPDLGHASGRELLDQGVATETAHRSERWLARRHQALTLPILAAVCIWPVSAHAKPHYPGDFTSPKKLHDLKKRVNAKKVPIIDPSALDRTIDKLCAKKRIRILHLGDSHVASDYITGMVRHGLQKIHGDGGRGF